MASKNNNYHLYAITMCQTPFYFMYAVGTLCICAYLILVILQGPLCDFLHFTEEETDTQQGVLTFPQLMNGRAT